MYSPSNPVASVCFFVAYHRATIEPIELRPRLSKAYRCCSLRRSTSTDYNNPSIAAFIAAEVLLAAFNLLMTLLI